MLSIYLHPRLFKPRAGAGVEDVQGFFGQQYVDRVVRPDGAVWNDHGCRLSVDRSLKVHLISGRLDQLDSERVSVGFAICEADMLWSDPQLY